MRADMEMRSGHFPGRPPIDAYGNGGFRFAEMSHRGSILIVPSGVYAWEPKSAEELQVVHFERVLAEAEGIEFLLLGTGAAFHPLDAGIRSFLHGGNIGVDVMDTGAAARTYNVVLAEQRRFAAALIAVD
ncbi:MAG TPA: Mth938-like domain-containing protein [Hyphomicrobiales bacterium]|nr:Mth938-like domain-containing protein [Rhodobiaceae bacterium]HXK53257.1 Mth938-like domain-containing protein [Hyphomicrobiales bacterium]